MDHGGHAQGPDNDKFVGLVHRVKAMTEEQQALRDLYARLMVRAQSENFNPKNMRCKMNATPIMREFQATVGNEVLKALLEEYRVRIIPSEYFPELASYLRLRNANALRNTLYRLGWKASYLRFEGRQHRVRIAQGKRIEEGRVRSVELSASYSDMRRNSATPGSPSPYSFIGHGKPSERSASTKSMGSLQRPAPPSRAVYTQTPTGSTALTRVAART